MGVTGLWSVVQPCARPIKIETLNKKRLAVDASIWIYQFLKAVRDKEGNALRNSHVVGFFRRICKLLFFGIKPVFVFDGGAPALKRQTISARKSRREGRREDAVRTAGKLLALQMQRRAEEEERKRKEEAQRPAHVEEEPLPENLVYVDELQMTPQERQQSRKFKKKDAYHLPDLDASFAEMGQPNDPRIMSIEELEQYARQFDTGEDINVYDFSKIDFNSPFFLSLPASDRYNILNAARLRSRLRMGYSKDQLDTMFPDRMAFSKFQIERVKERNELTQRLMNLNGMADDTMFGVNTGGRVAGEKGREYVLVKNDGVEGGWALGVVSAKDEGVRNKPIDVDGLNRRLEPEDEDENEEEEDGFEDVPIEGLNRLPKRIKAQDEVAMEIANKRRAYYSSRKQGARDSRASKRKPRKEDSNSLFISEEAPEEHNADMDWEDVDGNGLNDLFEEQQRSQADENDEELNRAIAMSLEKASGSEGEDDYLEVFQQARVEEATPFSRGSGQAIAHVANNRSVKAAPHPFAASDSEEENIDLQAALAESRKTKRQTGRSVHRPDRAPKASGIPPPKPAEALAGRAGAFDGPLPFEKLDLGSSLLGKKKMQKIQEDTAGGFEKAFNQQTTKPATPLPPWFSGDLTKDMDAQKAIEDEYRQRDKRADEEGYHFEQQATLRRQETGDVIDVDGAENGKQDVISIASSDQGDVIEAQLQNVVEDPEVRMGDLADLIRAEPPKQPKPMQQNGVVDAARTLQYSGSSVREPYPSEEDGRFSRIQADQPSIQPESTAHSAVFTETADDAAPDDKPYEWEESDRETSDIPGPKEGNAVRPAGGELRQAPTTSPSPEFENVEMPDEPIPPSANENVSFEERNGSPEGVIPMSGTADQDVFEGEPDEDNLVSDPEEDELFQQLAVEAEEHARFASTLNHKSQQQNIEDYERELKQLRNQQKKDRRDADEVTHIMVTECQQLLKFFGLPYITAPMEAEAQCAELVSLGLVDGIVTDDSDIFLFGGTRVYKNVFNQAKFVECYLSSDLEKEFDLTREKLIRIAHLLGSDYTEGLPGVGPVTALEIISEFPNLEEFKDWWQAVQMNIITKADDAPYPFRKKFRKNATKLFLPTTFPDKRVDIAYLQPEVDSDPSPFQWGVPDLDALRSFLMATIGWTQERTDEVLVPVIKDMNRRENEGTQANITNFFGGGSGAGAFAPRRRNEGKSKRMETALTRMADRAKIQRRLDSPPAARASSVGVQEDGNGEELLTSNDAVVAMSGSAVEKNLDSTVSNGRAKRNIKRRAAAGSLSSENLSASDDHEERPKKTRKSNKKPKRAPRKEKAAT